MLKPPTVQKSKKLSAHQLATKVLERRAHELLAIVRQPGHRTVKDGGM